MNQPLFERLLTCAGSEFDAAVRAVENENDPVLWAHAVRALLAYAAAANESDHMSASQVAAVRGAKRIAERLADAMQAVADQRARDALDAAGGGK